MTTIEKRKFLRKTIKEIIFKLIDDFGKDRIINDSNDYDIIRILNAMRCPPSNPNYQRFKPYMPDNFDGLLLEVSMNINYRSLSTAIKQAYKDSGIITR